MSQSSYFFSYFSLVVALIEPNLVLGQPIFGPEFTFTNNDVLKPLSDINRVGESWANLIRSRCLTQDCQEVSPGGEFGSEFAFEDGFWFRLGFDPGVIEVTTKPLTLEGFESQALRLQEMIFDTAREVGLFPHSEIGGGHIHLDIESTFGSDLNFIRNFVVDFHNHPELASGILGADHYNARPLAAMGPEIISAWRPLISRFDERFSRVSRGESLSFLRSEFFNEIRKFNNWLRPREAPARMLSLEYRPEKGTFEVRSFNPQTSADDFLSDLRLLKARLDVIKRQTSNLIVDVPNVQRLRDPFRETPHLTIEDAARFRRYVEESGLRWEEYRHLARPHTSPYLSKPVTVGSISTAVLPRLELIENHEPITQESQNQAQVNPRPKGQRNSFALNFNFCRDLLTSIFR